MCSPVFLRGRCGGARLASLIVLALAGCGRGGQPDQPSAKAGASGQAQLPAAGSVATGLRPGQQPPGFVAVDLDGKSQSPAAYKGDILLLHFWATWCPYCRREIPKLKQVVQDHSQHGVKVLAVSVDEDTEALKEFVRAQQLPYPVVAEIANGQAISAMYDVAGIPMTYVIDRRGLLAGRFQGQGNLSEAVAQMLAYEQQGQ